MAKYGQTSQDTISEVATVIARSAIHPHSKSDVTAPGVPMLDQTVTALQGTANRGIVVLTLAQMALGGDALANNGEKIVQFAAQRATAARERAERMATGAVAADDDWD